MPEPVLPYLPDRVQVDSHPEYAAEFIALSATARLGPAASRDTGWLRATYSGVTGDALARLAVRRFVREARRHGAASGVRGALAVLFDPLAPVWIQADLVLHIAAAYGFDPSASERAAELLVLWRVHPSIDSAGAALESARETAANQTPAIADEPTNGGSTVANVPPDVGNAATPPPLEAPFRAPNGRPPARNGRPPARHRGTRTRGLLARLVLPVGLPAGLTRPSAALRVRALAGLVPGAGALVRARYEAKATEELAARAVRFYRAATRGSARGTSADDRSPAPHAE